MKYEGEFLTVIFYICIIFCSLAQCVKVMVSIGVMLGYPLQFFIAIQIMLPNAIQIFHLQSRPFRGELLFRTIMVVLTCEYSIKIYKVILL